MEHIPGRRGRPRDPAHDAAVLRAVIDILDEAGLGAVSIEGAAARAGLAKTTIYRRWPNRAAMVAEAVFSEVSSTVPFPDTGSARTDFRLQLRHVARVLRGRSGRHVISLMAAALLDQEVATAFRKRFVEARRAEARHVLLRGVARGDIRADLDIEAMLDLLYAPFYFRLIVAPSVLTPGFVDRLIDALFSGMASPSAQTEKPPRRRASRAGAVASSVSGNGLPSARQR